MELVPSWLCCTESETFSEEKKKVEIVSLIDLVALLKLKMRGSSQ